MIDGKPLESSLEQIPPDIKKPYRQLTYWAGFFLTVHVAFAAYVNSTYLARFVGEEGVGLVYSASALATILAILFLTPILSRYGNLKTTSWLSAAALVVTATLGFTTQTPLVVGLFILYYVFGIIIRLDIDLYLESLSNNRDTGGIRGVFLTFANMAWLLSPILAGVVLDGGRYWAVYLISALAMAPLIYLSNYKLKPVSPPEKRKAHVFRLLKKLLFKPTGNYAEIRKILSVDLCLNIFFSVMVIYVPIYLNQHLGFDWTDLGVVFTVMLLPFVLFEYPLGRLADTKLGQKEILISGIVILITATAALSFIAGASLVVWGVALFMTRVGAAAIESMKETHLFKKIDEKSGDVVSLSRLMIPSSYIAGPILASAYLAIFPYQYIFVALAGFMILSLIPATTLKDTQ